MRCIVNMLKLPVVALVLFPQFADCADDAHVVPSSIAARALGSGAGEILGLEKYFDSETAKLDWEKKACLKWTLTRADVRFFFAHAKRVGFNIIDVDYATAPCDYRGIVRIAGKSVQFVINAGAYAVVGSNPDIAWYGCNVKCRRLFPEDLIGKADPAIPGTAARLGDLHGPPNVRPALG
jgi:hypothetical protein